MAIARKNYTSVQYNSSPATSLTYAFNPDNTANLLLVGTRFTTATETVTGITFDSEALTKAGFSQTGVSTGSCYVYYRKSPSVANANVVISASASGYFLSNALCYGGADGGVTTVETGSVSGATSISDSITVAAATNDSWVAAYAGCSDSWVTAFSTLTTVTEMQNYRWGDSNGTVAAGAYNYGATDESSPQSMVIIAVELAVAAATPPATPAVRRRFIRH